MSAREDFFSALRYELPLLQGSDLNDAIRRIGALPEVGRVLSAADHADALSRAIWDMADSAEKAAISATQFRKE